MRYEENLPGVHQGASFLWSWTV